MNNKYTLPIFIIIVGLLCGYFLTVIFSDNKKIPNNTQMNPSDSTQQNKQNQDIDVKITATTSELEAPKNGNVGDLKNAERSGLDIIYKNNSNQELTDVRIQIFSSEDTQYLIGSSDTAKFNKQKSAINKNATFDLKPVKSGQTGTALVSVYPKEAGVLRFQAFITTSEGKRGDAQPITITVR